jgi:hypothetical protein
MSMISAPGLIGKRPPAISKATRRGAGDELLAEYLERLDRIKAAGARPSDPRPGGSGGDEEGYYIHKT